MGMAIDLMVTSGSSYVYVYAISDIMPISQPTLQHHHKTIILQLAIGIGSPSRFPQV
jgi:hypothetical protein